MNSPFDAATLAGFELAMTASPNPMLLVDDEGSIAMANPAAESLFGRSVVGSPVEKLLPQERAEHHAQLRRAWMANPTPRPMGRARDLVALRVDGERMPVEIGLTTFRRDGRTWTMCSVVDLSTRRRLEAEREAAWGRALQAQRLEGLGLLAGGVAHDFNNLLVGVIGNANLAIGVLQPGTTAHDYVQDVLRAAQQASALARQMLTYSGRGTNRIDALDLSSLVNDLRDLIRSTVPRHIEVCLVCPRELPLVTGDANQLRQVLLNLVHNAAEAISTHGRIVVETGTTTVGDGGLPGTVPASLAPGSWVTLSVKDDGPGMSPEVVDRMFDPFYTTKPAGHGLGLAASMGIVRAHRGGFLVRSEEGVGTAITMYLPADRSVAPVVEERPAIRATVLLADDEPIVRRMARRVLVSAGFQVVEAEDGLDALRRFEQSPDAVDIVVLDASMPGLSGAEVFSAVRAKRPEIPILLSSGFNESEATSRLRDQGLNGFLQKPYTPDDLVRVITRTLQRSRAPAAPAPGPTPDRK